METSLFNRVQATLLALATAALFVLAVFNLLQERQFQQPDDGVWWREAAGGLEPKEFCPTWPASAPASRSGPADRSQRQRHSDDVPVSRIADLERALYRTGSYGQVYYTITRDGIPLDTPVKVIPEPLDRSLEPGTAPHRPHLPDHRLLRSLPPLGRSARHPLLPLLPGFVRAGTRSSTRASSTGWTGPSSGPISWPSRCSPRSSFISLSASPRSASRTSAAAGSCRWSTRPARACFGSVALGHQPLAGHRAAQAPPRPDRDRLRRRLLRSGRAALPAQLQPGRHARCCASS